MKTLAFMQHRRANDQFFAFAVADVADVADVAPPAAAAASAALRASAAACFSRIRIASSSCRRGALRRVAARRGASIGGQEFFSVQNQEQQKN